MPERVLLVIGQLKAQSEFVVEERHVWWLVVRWAIESFMNILNVIYDLIGLIFMHVENKLITF